MIERQGTWGELELATTVLSKTGEPLYVADIKGDWILFKDRGGHGYPARRPSAARGGSSAPITILEATEEEAELQLVQQLSAAHLVDREREKRMPERAKQWLVPPFPTGGREAVAQARDHLQWYHGTYAGTAENGGFRTLKQMAAAHDEMHDPDAVGGIFMDKPHTHRKGA